MISYAIDGRFLQLTVVGDFTTEELRHVLHAAATDPQLPPRALLLVDVRESTAMPTLDEVQERFAQFRRLIWHVAPVCAIVTTPTKGIVMGELYRVEATVRASLRVELFREPAEARRWLAAEVPAEEADHHA